MSELPSRVRRALRDHDAFERVADGVYEVSSAFDGTVTVSMAGEGRVAFDVTVQVPMLSEATADDVADVVEEGWYETFERRTRDVAGVTRGEHDADPEVRREDGQAVFEMQFTDINERRGVDDARALVNYVEGTYVQGVIPGYEYTGAVSELVSQAAQTGGGDGTQRGGTPL